MKVLISPAHYYFSDKYGSEPGYAYSLVKYIGERFDTIDVIVGFADIATPLPKNINLISIYKTRGDSPTLELMKYILFYPLVCLKYLTLHKKYDVVHHMFPTSPKTIDPLLGLVKLVSPSTKIVIGPLQLLSQLTSKAAFSIMLTGKKTNSPFIFILSLLFKFLLLITAPLNRRTFACADVIVCNFKIIRNFYLPVFPKKKIAVIPTGVDPFVDAPVKKKTNKSVTIISVGRLQDHKGHKYLLEAFKLLAKDIPTVKLILVGEGELKQEYLDFAKTNHLEKSITFTGFVNRDKVAQWYDKANIFCLPSLIDTNPVVVIEAMRNHLPVVASDVGAVAEIVGDSGIIVEKANATEIYQALKKLVKDKKLCDTMSKNGYNRVKKYYTWDSIADQWVKLYKNL